MAGSFVRADKASQDVQRWVQVDQTLFTAAILNVAINAGNAMPMETREREEAEGENALPPHRDLGKPISQYRGVG
jgi:hypothetical protein